jgi:hypothetical protein
VCVGDLEMFSVIFRALLLAIALLVSTSATTRADDGICVFPTEGDGVSEKMFCEHLKAVAKVALRLLGQRKDDAESLVANWFPEYSEMYNFATGERYPKDPVKFALAVYRHKCLRRVEDWTSCKFRFDPHTGNRLNAGETIDPYCWGGCGDVVDLGTPAAESAPIARETKHDRMVDKINRKVLRDCETVRASLLAAGATVIKCSSLK